MAAVSKKRLALLAVFGVVALVILGGGVISYLKYSTPPPPPPRIYKLLIPPGFTLKDIALRVGEIPGHKATSFLLLANSGKIRSVWQPPGVTSLEGLLSPNTYFVTRFVSDRTIIDMMLTQFTLEARQTGLNNSAKLVGLNPYQTLIVASIIQQEGKLAGDLPKIARVIYNRLSAGMALQMDSTVRYALGYNPTVLTVADTKVNSLYNTYLHKGLPPTPISAAGPAAIQAALHPANGNWMYFVVVSPNGAEAFSATYAQQLQNEALARQRMGT
ncbi:MAG: endolytic transglycosylase MltG [Actinobacteria bacterium]|nr:endolytic transglycosylase MltG [Actinomycetota bacterium]MCL6105677.1 endolytic transglycosylase MltG [Actinomycetota bacterium]